MRVRVSSAEKTRSAFKITGIVKLGSFWTDETPGEGDQPGVLGWIPGDELGCQAGPLREAKQGYRPRKHANTPQIP